jgi:hypothetical protein
VPIGIVAELFEIVAPVYLCVAAGYLWAVLGRRYDVELITDLIFNVGAPCLVFSSFVAMRIEPARMLEMAVATVAALVCFAAIATPILKLTGRPLTSFLSPMIFGNTGNMGMPVSLFAFGEDGLALGVCFFATTAFAQFTVGIWLWSGTLSLRSLVANPLAISVVLSVVVLTAGIDVPGWMSRTTQVLGNFTIPLMQFTLGVTLGRLALSAIPQSVALSVLRIGMGVSVGVALSHALGLEGIVRGVFIVDCAMPVAVFNYLMAERYGRTPAEVASVVVMSTLISLVTLPLVLAYVL